MSQLIKSKIPLSDDDQKRIAKAVELAEKKTSGEIATALIKESSDYAVYELYFSLIAGFLYFTFLLIFYPAVSSWMENLFWSSQSWYVTAFYGLTTILFIGLTYFFSNLPFVDRLIVPRKVMDEKVRSRAMQHFTESGVYSTRDHTGILIFISLLERRVEILADKGISDKIPQDQWDSLVADLSVAIKNGDMADGLCRAVESCGKKLSGHFPIKADDTNELSDSVDILES